MNEQLVKHYGRLWARNLKNIKRLETLKNRIGVYVLCDGSMPVYIGQTNNLHKRMLRHNRSKTKRLYWDHFTWFAIAKPEFLDDVEALMIRMLPFYLRILNRQRPKFANEDAQWVDIDKTDKYVDPAREFPRFAPKSKKR